jgi:pantothenate synthetase
MTPLDHGMLSGIRRRSTPTQERKRAAGIERTIDQAVAAVKAGQDAERVAARAAYRAATAPVPFTPDELKAARAIRTSVGWHRVIRVNAKSVTVATEYSWTDRYSIDKILEVKS